MIPKNFIESVIKAVDIAQIVGQYIQLTNKGQKNLFSLCPFHQEKTPSFSVNNEEGFYHCFGCGAHGNVITFLMQYLGIDFLDAVKKLADTSGLSIPNQQRGYSDTENSRQYKTTLQTIQLHYCNQLKNFRTAIDYLESRNIKSESLVKFGVGWSGKIGSIRQLNINDQVLQTCGLICSSQDGKLYERFRKRIMFPIRDISGCTVGFGGRVIDNSLPKYLNSPENVFFSKRTILYGLWEAKQAIRKENKVLIVEGYTDVISLSQAGINYVVATLGTATTADHIEILSRLTKKIIFAFDGDQAGKLAAWRALNICLPLIKNELRIYFIFLLNNSDPDSYIRTFGAKKFLKNLDNACPLSKFLFDELASKFSLEHAEGRSNYLLEINKLIKMIPDSLFQSQLKCDLEEYLQLPLNEFFYKNNYSKRIVSKKYYVPKYKAKPLEEYLFSLLLTNLKLVKEIDFQQIAIINQSINFFSYSKYIQKLILFVQINHVYDLESLFKREDFNPVLRNEVNAKLHTRNQYFNLSELKLEWNDSIKKLQFKMLTLKMSKLVKDGLNSSDNKKEYLSLLMSLKKYKVLQS